MPNQSTKSTDLIAIANPELAQKLAANNDAQGDFEESKASAVHERYNEDLWKTLRALNYLRYIFAIICLFLLFIENQFDSFEFFGQLKHRNLVYAALVVFPFSAILITHLSKSRQLALKPILAIQFALDLLQTAFLIHAAHGQHSFFLVIYFMIVATGSIILSRREALGLASAAVIIMFVERSYTCVENLCYTDSISQLADQSDVALFAILLMFIAYGISSLASSIRRQTKTSAYKLGNESIESYLKGQEKEALRSALRASRGNKTEAAKLLGMTFRSFRYKLSKYEID